MFCTNCGAKLHETADVCLKCGKMVEKEGSKEIVKNNSNSNSNRITGKAIASLVLGILAIGYTLLIFLGIEEAVSTAIFTTMAFRIGYAIGVVLIQSIFAIIAIILGGIDRSKQHNGINTAGFFLALSSLILIAIQFLYVMVY